jgi:hypothetical protein
MRNGCLGKELRDINFNLGGSKVIGHIKQGMTESSYYLAIVDVGMAQFGSPVAFVYAT